MMCINPDSKAKLAGMRILIVEDEPLLAFDYQDEFEASGAAATVALTLEEGLGAVACAPFEFAVLDVNLGSDVIWPVARLLSSRAVPYVFVTGRATAVAGIADVTPVACIDKPIGGRALSDRVAEYLAVSPVTPRS